MKADRFALPLQETLDMNGWDVMNEGERASCVGDFAREHVEICTRVSNRIMLLASHAGRAFPRTEPT